MSDLLEYLTECGQEDRAPYTIQDFCKGREHESFEIFFKNFVPAIVAKNKFKLRLFAPNSDDQNMCTVSDEACTLLLLENNFDRWIDVHKNKTEGSTRLDPAITNKDEKRKRKWESDVSPKYTEGGICYSDARKLTHRGWKDEGILRFNTLCVMVKQDRTAYPNVLPAMIHTWKEKMHRSTPVVTEEVETSTEAYHELWEETSEQGEAV
jgi:hypothetical protein